MQNLSQVVHTSHTTPPAHPHAPPPDATSYHQALSMHQIHYDFHLTRTRKKASHRHGLRWSIRLHAINSCSSEGTGQGEEKGRKGSVISHTRRPYPIGNRSAGSPVSAQHGVWEASLLETYLASTDSQVITAMRDAGQRCHQEAQTSDAARRAQLGKPHVHVFGAINADAFLLARRHRQRNSKRSRSTTISFVVAEHARQDLSCRLMMNPAGPHDAAFVFRTAHPSKNSNENIEVSRYVGWTFC